MPLNTITVVGVIIASLASLAACITSARNFMKGWREKLIRDQQELDDIQECKETLERLVQRVEALERRGRR